MDEHAIAPRSEAAVRSEHAVAELARLFEEHGWTVRREPAGNGLFRPDLVIRRGRLSYVVEVKAAAEGRGDRLVPLWSHAHLQALHYADAKRRPLAVVVAPKIAPRAADQIMRSIGQLAPEAAVGVLDLAGLRRFRGPGLDELDVVSAPSSRKRVTESGEGWFAQRSQPHAAEHVAPDLFSDLNQWMLKVLLAPEIPSALLSAPREQYGDASHLARNAGVSAMSASRLVRQLQHEGYLDPGRGWLHLVRREELFRRWQASSHRRVKEIRLRFLLRGHPDAELRKVLKRGGGALALFSAADALHLGFVHGAPRHVYVAKLDAVVAGQWKNLAPIAVGEEPDVIVRQAPAMQSVFRGAVRVEGVPVCDVLQIWLDVASHPSRGQEQADHIRKRVLAPVIEGASSDG